MTPFAAAARAAANAHDRIMGETFEFRPMMLSADVNARPVVDPARAIVLDLLAVWGEPSARADSGPVRTPGVMPEKPGHASARPFLSLELARLPYAPQRGDIVVRVATAARYRVAEILPSTPGFARLDLNRI
jgi:hypothetical protein